MDVKWIAIVVPLALALITALWGIYKNLSRRIDDEVETIGKRIDDQGDRIAKVELRQAKHAIRIESIKTEVVSLRQRWHVLREETMKEAYKMWGEWKDEIVDKWERWKHEILDKLRERK